MMKKVSFGFMVLAGMLLVAVFPSCGTKKSVVPADTSVVTTKNFKPDVRFTSLDSLADFMMEEFAVKTPDEFVNRYNLQAAAIQSYGLLNNRKEDEYPLDETVCSDLRLLADSLSGGSTIEMVMCGRIWRGVCHYLTAKDYCSGYSNNPLYQAEMRDWLALEDELGSFYVDLAYLTYWGGTIAHVVASGSMWNLAEARQDDYSKLCKNGPFDTDKTWTIASARENFLQELADAKSLEPYDGEMYDPEGYRALLKEMSECADRVAVLLDKWLDSRAKLCAAEGIPDKHTAHLITVLGTRIMELIEG